MSVPTASFKQRILSGELIVGTFVKTPSLMVSEVLAQTNLDVCCLDAEHSPFDRGDLDACLLAYQIAKKPSLVRVATGSSEHILSALDSGATGVVIPHVDSLDKAQNVARLCHFGSGGRGYAGSPRSAGYATRTLARNLEQALLETVVVAQIEDLTAIEAIDDIAAVEGIDCLFIGMMDLTVAAGASGPEDERVIAMAERVCAAGQASDRRIGMFVSSTEEIAFWRDRGVSFFLLQSDHYFIQQGAAALIDMKRQSQ